MFLSQQDFELKMGCLCAGSGCGGHLSLGKVDIRPEDIHPTGWQGAAQHTYTAACDGFHEPSPCPPSRPVQVIYPGTAGIVHALPKGTLPR